MATVTVNGKPLQGKHANAIGDYLAAMTKTGSLGATIMTAYIAAGGKLAADKLGKLIPDTAELVISDKNSKNPNPRKVTGKGIKAVFAVAEEARKSFEELDKISRKYKGLVTFEQAQRDNDGDDGFASVEDNELAGMFG